MLFSYQKKTTFMITLFISIIHVIFVCCFEFMKVYFVPHDCIQTLIM